MSGRIIDGELAEVAAQRNEQNRIIAELQSSNQALLALYQDALVTIANLRAEYEPRPRPGETPPNPLDQVTDVAVLKDVAVRKIVGLQVDLALAQRRADAEAGRAAEAGADLAAATKRADDNWQSHVASSNRHGSTYKTLLDTTAKLGAANKEIVRLKSSRDEWKSRANWAEGYDGGERKRLIEQRDQAQAKLGRAVAALRLAWDEAVPAVLPGSKGYIADAVIAVLADADSKAAGEAWAAAVAYVAALAQADCGEGRPSDLEPYRDRFMDAFAAVDARRGGGR